MSGVVLDPDGRPISGAQFNHTGPQSSGPKYRTERELRSGHKGIRDGDPKGRLQECAAQDREFVWNYSDAGSSGPDHSGLRWTRRDGRNHRLRISFCISSSPPNQSESPVERLGLLRSDLLDKDATRNPDDPGHGPNLRLTYKLQGKTVTEIFPSPGCSA